MATKKTIRKKDQSPPEVSDDFDSVLRTMLATMPDPRKGSPPKAKKAKNVKKDATLGGGAKRPKKIK